VVPSIDAVAPPAAVGLPVARTGGHEAAQAPVQVLLLEVSFLNRYTVRPCESTRMLPTLLPETPMVAAWPLASLGTLGDDDALSLLLPPQPATARAAIGIAASPRRVRRLWIMSGIVRRCGRSVHTGNPVRAAILAAPAAAQATPGLLVFGGSQGARRLNDALLDAAGRLGPRIGALRIHHQTGVPDHDRMVAGWASLGIAARVDAFVTDMGGAYAEADVVVARSGAMSCAEITARGLPAILVPYPHAADDHQRHNAEALVRAGAATLLLDRDCDGDRLAAALAPLLDDADVRGRMAAASRAAGRPDAAARVADVCDAEIRADGS